MPLEITSAASATDAAIQNKRFGSRTALAFSNEKIDYIMKTVESLKDAVLLTKGAKNDVTKTKRRIFRYLICYLGY